MGIMPRKTRNFCFECGKHLIFERALSNVALFNYGDLTCTNWVEFSLIHNFEQSI